MESYWFNFDTKNYDYREAPETVEDAISYIPGRSLDDSEGPARSLFRLYVDGFGMSVTEASVKVLKLYVGEDA